MIEITSNNVRLVKPLSKAELRAALAWHGDKSVAQIIAMKLEHGGRFCVVQGDYSRRKTVDIEESLRHLAQIGAHRSPAARHLAGEIARRRRGLYSFAAPTDPNGPRAA